MTEAAAPPEREITLRWREIHEFFSLDDLSDFADRLDALATEHRIPPLADYSRRLRTAMARNDIDEMERLIAEYPEMTANLSERFN